jgi:N-acetylmuramoyl-L-alanine amidase
MQPKNVLKTIIIDPGHGIPDVGARGLNSTEAENALAIATKLGEQLRQNLPNTKIIFTRTDQYLPDHLTSINESLKRRAQIANENHGDLFISIHLNSSPDRIRKDVVGHTSETYYTYSGKGKKKKKVAHTRSVPVYKTYHLGCESEGTEVYIWAVGKAEQKKEFVGSGSDEEMSEDSGDSSAIMFDSPEAKIRASILTKKFFNNSRMLAEYVQEEFEKQGRVNRGVLQRNNKGIWVLQATAMPSILVETGYICNRDEEGYLSNEKDQNEIAFAVMRGVLRYKESLENGNLPVVSQAVAAVTDSTNQ